MKKLDGQVAWVSGGTKGIGAAVAELFASEGAKVAFTGRDEKGGRRVEERIARQGFEAMFIPCEATDEAQVKNSIEKTAAAFKKLDILVNNAGIVDVRMLHEYSYEEWRRVLDVNVSSMFLAFKHAFSHLSAGPKSYVVNIGSISSFVGQAGTPAYTASKGAVLQLSRSIGLDYAKYGIRCNCICPGITDTPMLRQHLNANPDPGAHLEKRLKRVPLGTILSPVDIAKSALYFSCEDSAGITATSLVVDGGYLACAEWDGGS
ncbi:MAG: SDR family oxidoreductase [Oscillospiraceae bacterium]|nr:SDR family oxidoreductase [Oscillospiraceae bacterium]